MTNRSLDPKNNSTKISATQSQRSEKSQRQEKGTTKATSSEYQGLQFDAGQVIDGDWVFERRVNEGGFGAIYAVTHPQAVETMHNNFYIHRDIKPGNAAVGFNDPKRIYLFDFGLARRYVEFTKDRKGIKFREARKNAPFRGTYHYCSVQQHDRKDACRRDDLWALMYTMIEFLTVRLPWEFEKEKAKIKKLKQTTPTKVLLQGCPVMFEPLLVYLDKLDFKSKPAYDYFRSCFLRIMEKRGFDANEPYDWETHKQEEKATLSRTREKAVFDHEGGLQSLTTITRISSVEEASSAELADNDNDKDKDTSSDHNRVASEEEAKSSNGH